MKFAVVDLSNSLTVAELTAYATAQRDQLNIDYAEAYDGDGVLDQVRVATSASAVDADEVAIFLHATVPANGPDGAIGFHEISKTGMPVCHVFLDLAHDSGVSWASCASHEVLETRADPRLHACVELDNGQIWDREICDRVEADTYQRNSVEISNFNTPECFEPTGAPGEKYDHLGLSTKPNEVRPGGYAQQYDQMRGWIQHGTMRPYRAALAAMGMTRNARRAKRRHRDEDGSV